LDKISKENNEFKITIDTLKTQLQDHQQIHENFLTEINEQKSTNKNQAELSNESVNNNDEIQKLLSATVSSI
jgi:hypothetical protein